MKNKILIISIILITTIFIFLFLQKKYFQNKNYSNQIIRKLNAAIADEWLAHYQYWIGSKILKGTLKEEVSKELEQHSKEELEHATMLADRIIELGGTPLLEPKKLYSKSICGYMSPKSFDQRVILQENLDGEICAINVYEKLLSSVNKNDIKTVEIIKKILSDEIEHKHDLEKLIQKLDKKIKRR